MSNPNFQPKEVEITFSLKNPEKKYFLNSDSLKELENTLNHSNKLNEQNIFSNIQSTEEIVLSKIIDVDLDDLLNQIMKKNCI